MASAMLLEWSTLSEARMKELFERAHLFPNDHPGVIQTVKQLLGSGRFSLDRGDYGRMFECTKRMRHDAPLQQAASRQTLQTAWQSARGLLQPGLRLENSRRCGAVLMRAHLSAQHTKRYAATARQKCAEDDTILHKCTEIHCFSSGHHVHFTIQESGTKTNLLKGEGSVTGVGMVDAALLSMSKIQGCHSKI